MVKFPLKFEVSAEAGPGIENNWIAQSDELPPIQSAIPAEFMGPGSGYSPEDLFALAVLNCLIATYKVYCAKAQISFQQIRGRTILTVDKQPSEAGFYMSHLEFFLDVTGCSQPEQGKKILESAIRDCAVSNSVKSGKSFHVTVE